MPAVSKAQRRAIAIAEHHPEELYARDKGLANMTHKQQHDFAATPEGNLPEHKKQHGKHAKVVHHSPAMIEVDHTEGHATRHSLDNLPDFD